LHYPAFVDDDSDLVIIGDKTWLIIDGDKDSAQILRDNAKRLGHECLVAGNGHRGIYLAQYYQPGAIVFVLAHQNTSPTPLILTGCCLSCEFGCLNRVKSLSSLGYNIITAYNEEKALECLSVWYIANPVNTIKGIAYDIQLATPPLAQFHL
jgi:hypothetical protein